MRIKGGGYMEISDGMLRSENSDVPPLPRFAHFKAIRAGASSEFTLGLFGLLPSQVRSNGAALLMEMGTGKSLTTIGVAGTLYEFGRINRLLVVYPLSITGVWLDEFQKQV